MRLRLTACRRLKRALKQKSNSGLLSINTGLPYGKVACKFGLVGFPDNIMLQWPPRTLQDTPQAVKQKKRDHRRLLIEEYWEVLAVEIPDRTSLGLKALGVVQGFR